MATAQATLNNLRQSPRKVRLVADLMRGKKANDALSGLPFVDKRAAAPLAKLLQSAIANARNLDLDIDTLFVKTITVNGGGVLARRRPTARGRAFPIRKRTSNVTLVLEPKVKGQKSKAKSEKPAEVKAEPKEPKPKAVRAPRAKKSEK